MADHETGQAGDATSEHNQEEVRKAKEDARAVIRQLVDRFKQNQSDYLDSSYNETQARTEFITPMLEAFGWDIHNRSGQPLAYREVIEEATVEMGEERQSKRPDYELRIARQRKLFVEAKKPSVKIDRDRGPAFQTRRYGYSASLPISIVTNFSQLAIYDCSSIPHETDQAHVARLHVCSFEDFDAHFEELWSLLSKQSILSGEFDRRFSVASTRHGAEQFDDYFLKQVRDWRKKLAVDIHKNSPRLTSEELTYAVQLFLSRIIFLRICEDREIEKYKNLKNLDGSATFDAFKAELRRADEFYDSGLFRLIDDEPLGIRISDSVLKEIIEELYYPQSPYTFAVVETEVLGQIYEQFLGEVIEVEAGEAKIVSKPEVRESGGVVSTPGFIADAIVARTLGPLLSSKAPDELENFTVADTCCGSGIFLLSAFNYLLGHYLNWYVANGPEKHSGVEIYQVGEATWRLTFEEKRRILLRHLRGVDIDANAVEVAQFSLLLKLIEDETSSGLQAYVRREKHAALPELDESFRCGNSLVSTEEWTAAHGAMSSEQRDVINPFSWRSEFADEIEAGGFDAIVGNPPYIRIQNMVTYSPDEVEFYSNAKAPYSVARQDNFDKYSLFIERSLELSKETGRIGVIVPNKFMTIRSGRSLRGLLSGTQIVEEIVDFGVKPVFGQETSNYTCIIVMDKSGVEEITIEKAGPLEEWRYGKPGSIIHAQPDDLSAAPWSFGEENVRLLFARVKDAIPGRLSAFANIEVGVQTSADKIYLLQAKKSNAQTITFQKDGKEWQIEKGILRPCLHDEQVEAFGRPEPNAWMIFPYELTTAKGNKMRARLLQPAELQSKYPLCWEYLEAHRTKLEKRSIAGGATSEKQWYQYGRSQSLTKFDQPKIILPVLSREARYAFDETNTIITGGGNGPYYMIRSKEYAPVSTLYLLAVLNHPFCEALVRSNTSVFRGGYYSHGKQFIEDLPIPVPEEPDEQREVEALVKKIVHAEEKLKKSRTPRAQRKNEREVKDLRADLEQKISRLFGLSSEDLSVADSVEVPS
ncbi:Eco57I restriction-modification methylase domain-containing protein [Roseovarius indicus]|uniref:Eco57I restriction-modification methylase domain-containing protein n=1 Tax=Roseovarius indicus TaxID=540747 RepID=UPI00351611A4